LTRSATAEKQGSNNGILASVIIPNYQGADCILDCIRSVLIAGRRDVELVVVDNASPDKSADIVQVNYPSVKLIRLASNVGYGEACNIGARGSIGTYLVFLNNDTIAVGEWLRELIAPLVDRRNGATCSKVTFPGSPETVDSCGGVSDIYGFAWNKGKGEVDVGQYDSFRDCFYAVGSSLAVRRDVFEAVGGFDKELFMYVEDVDLSWRIRLLGFNVIYVPKSRIVHRSGITRMKTSDIQYLFNRNRLRMILKNYSVRTLVSILPRYLVLQMGLLIWVISRLRGDELRTVLAAWLWNARHLRDTMRSRRVVQAKRRVKDDHVMVHMINKPAGILFLLRMIRNPVLETRFN